MNFFLQPLTVERDKHSSRRASSFGAPTQGATASPFSVCLLAIKASCSLLSSAISLWNSITRQSFALDPSVWNYTKLKSWSIPVVQWFLHANLSLHIESLFINTSHVSSIDLQLTVFTCSHWLNARRIVPRYFSVGSIWRTVSVLLFLFFFFYSFSY